MHVIAISKKKIRCHKFVREKRVYVGVKGGKGKEECN